MFVTKQSEILELIDAVDPILYGKTRNHIDGAVTKLSPYISRGVISTKQIAQTVLDKDYKPYQIEIFLKELAWRDYFQQVWISKRNEIDEDLKQSQHPVSNHFISENIVSANTSINAIDQGIKELYASGYMHNHLRMYVASCCCNLAQSHWMQPAKWMYYHLLDADWASNALSWQWVAGSFSSKKYFANQENINKYCYTNQKNTFLDVSYDALVSMDIPEVLKSTAPLSLQTNLPVSDTLTIDAELPIYIYNFYNLDLNWDVNIKANRILLLEPQFFKKYPVADKTIDFILSLANNIKGIQIIVGEFDAIFDKAFHNHIHYKEHPAVTHYKGVEHQRDWIFEKVQGYFPSFYSYWKKCENIIL